MLANAYWLKNNIFMHFQCCSSSCSCCCSFRLFQLFMKNEFLSVRRRINSSIAAATFTVICPAPAWPKLHWLLCGRWRHPMAFACLLQRPNPICGHQTVAGSSCQLSHTPCPCQSMAASQSLPLPLPHATSCCSIPDSCEPFEHFLY